MFIKKIHFVTLQNEEHFQFNSYFDELVMEAKAASLKVETQYAAYKPLLVNERQALDLVIKSSYTARIDTGDTERDTPTRGFFKVVDGMLHHFNPAITAAAYRIKVINDSFSDITRLPYENQTAATIKFIDALKAASADITLLSLTDWVTEIEAKNNAFDALVKTRFTETDDRTVLRMKDVRLEVDAAYTAITNRINAYITIDGDADYATFVTKLNNRIDSFANTVAMRKGRGKKADGVSGEVK